MKRKRVSARFRSDASKKPWRKIVIITLVLVLTSASGFYLWKNRAHKIDTSGVTASFHRFTNWVAEHRHRLNQKVVKVKEMAEQKSEEPIHFEFYSELPNTMVPVPASNESNQT